MNQAPHRNLYLRSDLERLINPRHIAVVGASETMGGFGQRTVENLRGFSGTVTGVNPKYASIDGRDCVPSLADLTEAPDAVVVAVAQHLVQPTLEQAAQIGAGGAIVYASGYGETGTEHGLNAQREIVEFSRRTGVRVAGPNCVGIINLNTGAAMNFMQDSGTMVQGKAGGIAIVSQSGALGYTALQAVQRGAGVSHYLAAGNSADIDICDYIAYLAAEPTVQAIICLLEGVKSGKRFLEAARLAEAAGIPLIVYKSGNSVRSGQAALSHTGTLTGSVDAYRAAFDAVGVIRVDDLEGLVETAAFFARNQAPPTAPGVGIMSTSGGAGVICADKAEEHGLALPDLAAPARATLEEVVPDFGSVGNPADLTAEVLKDASTFASCVAAFTEDTNFGAVVVPFVFVHEATTGLRAPMLSAAAAGGSAAVAAVWMNESLEGPGSAELDADTRVTLFRSADRCMATIRHWQDWHAGRALRRSEASGAARASAPEAARIAAEIIAGAGARGQTALSEAAAKRVLNAYGIRTPAEEIAANPTEAAAAAERIGYPVVLKVLSADILHKTEAGGIRVNLSDGPEVRAAAADILSAVTVAAPGARVDGLSVQAMIPPGPEIILGAHQDPQFGPIITVGSGGVLVEVLADVCVRLARVTRQEARRALASLRGYPLLTGVRGDAGYDVESLVDTVVRFSELAADLLSEENAAVAECEINPVIVGRSGAVAADALMIFREIEPAQPAADRAQTLEGRRG